MIRIEEIWEEYINIYIFFLVKNEVLIVNDTCCKDNLVIMKYSRHRGHRIVKDC